MAYSKIELAVLEMAQPVAEENGCYIYDVEYVKEGKSNFLRIFADKENDRISLDECEVISRRMSDLLDEKDPIQGEYMLEVSSPGIERRLRTPMHFEMYMGETVDIGLYKAINGNKTISGKLLAYEDEKITIENEDGNLTIMQSETTSVRLHFDF